MTYKFSSMAILLHVLILVIFHHARELQGKLYDGCHYPSSVCGSVTVNEADRITLQRLSASFSFMYENHFPNDWKASLTCAEGWTRVCTDSRGRVTELDFRNLGINSSISSSLGNLTKLLFLDFGSNNISSIPSSIRSLTELLHLDLSENYLVSNRGFDNIGFLAKLTFLNLMNTQINATHFSTITKLKNLQHLNVRDNQIDRLPSSIGLLTKLIYFDAWNNHMKSIPSSLVFLSHLQYLDLSFNKLTSSIWPFISKLTQLNYLNLGTNLLDSLPNSSLNPLTKLTYLDLNYNLRLRGVAIPTLDTLTSLQHLDLRLCGLSGKIPTSYVKMKNLSRLDLSDNRLCGEVPAFRQNLNLVVDHNFLSGTLPFKVQGIDCQNFGYNCLSPISSCEWSKKSSYECSNQCSPVPGLNKDLTQSAVTYFQSSTYWIGYAKAAVDGSAGFGNFSHRSCSHTLTQTDPSFAIELPPSDIGIVQLYNRLDCCSDRLNGVQVYVGYVPKMYWESKKCTDPKFKFGPNNRGFPINVTCNIRGSLVWIVVPGKKKILSLCEVVVFPRV